MRKRRALCMAALAALVVAMGAARLAQSAEPPVAYGPPAWSPDGDELAFAQTSTPSGNTVNRLLVAEVTTGRMRELMSGSQEEPVTAKWSPNGHFIAYRASSFRIWVIRPDGRGHRVVGGGANFDWSPDSRRIAYDTAGNGGAISVVDVKTGRRRSVTRRRYHSEPEWSPDGARIAFTWRRPDDDSPPKIAVMRPDGSRLTKLAPGFAPKWSPNGRRLAFSTQDVGAVSLMNADGTAQRKLAVSGWSVLAASPWFLAPMPWSPDGRSLLVTRGNSIVVLRLTGRRPARLADGYWPAWSPNGKQIAFAALRGCGAGVFIMDADGTDLRRLTRCP
jgi:Tol biopolymer transport system component